MKKFSNKLFSVSFKKYLSFVLGALFVSSINTYAAETTAATGNKKNAEDKTVSEKTAQAENDKNPHRLSIVTVNAQKRKQSVQDVASAVTAISGTSITETGGGQSAAAVLQSVPNASGANNDGNVRSRWWIRGLGSGDTSNNLVTPIGLYYDEVYINALILGGIPLFDLSQVEVLRGPQGTLWGKNTTGGAVNFSTKKPTFTPDGYAKLDVGNYGAQIAQVAVGGPINGETLAGRISVYSQDQDGFGNNPTADTKLGKNFSERAVRGQLLASFSPDVQALLSFFKRDFRGDGENNQGIGLGVNGTNSFGYQLPGLGESYDRSLNAPVSDELSSSGSTLNVNWQLDKLTFTSISSFIEGDRVSNGDGDNTPTERNRSHSSSDAKQFTQEFRLASPKNDRLSWIAGVHYFSETINSNASGGALPDTPNLSFFNNLTYQQDTESYAIFGSSTYNFTDRFNVTAGLRWSNESKKIDLSRLQNPGGTATSALGKTTFRNTTAWWLPSSVSSTLQNNVVQKADTTWDDATWDITPQYHLSKDASIYARIAKGFRGGTYNVGVVNQGDTSTVNPEYLLSYEGGFKSSWFNNRLTTNAAIFYYDYKDIQVNKVIATGNTTQSILTNGPKATVKGFELEVAAAPVADLRLNAALGLLRTEFTEYGEYTGNEFGRAPHTNVLLGGAYTFHLGADEIILQTDWNYKDAYFFSTVNQIDPYLRQNSYVVGNAQVSYVTNSGLTTFTAYVRNLTDQFYKTNGIPAGYNARTYGLSDPRTFGVTVLQRW